MWEHQREKVEMHGREKGLTMLGEKDDLSAEAHSSAQSGR